MQTNPRTRHNLAWGWVRAFPLSMAPSGDPDDGSGKSASFDGAKAEGEDLSYKIELWDPARKIVEQVLAITASGSIGYAAYYAATREFPDRYLTLRHKNRTIARWNGPRQ